MNGTPTDLTNFRGEVLDQTPLGQICGSRRLFRNRYQVLHVLGRGGFGVTFLARDVSLPSAPYCVIKQLCPKVNDPTALERARKRFQREAETLSKLGSHAQIPQLLDYFEDGGEFYLVQEYVRGLTLSRELRRTGPQSEEAVKQFLLEILPLLQYVHKNQVIHRDIKPQNIIRCQDDGRLVLIDFGAVKARIAEVEDVTNKAPTTHFIGTVGFSPPEQLAMRPVYASDIYALGVTCLCLLTAKPPLYFESDPQTGDICWQEQLPVSEHFAKILNRMLKVSLRDRYRSVREILAALQLEPYLESLSHCLTHHPRPVEEDEQADAERGKSAYLSPLSRTALAIRRWKRHLKTKGKSSDTSNLIPFKPN